MPARDWLIFEAGTWREAAAPAAPATRFAEIRAFYPNLVDYLRIVMCVAAGATLAARLPLATAALVIGSWLLDWIDGPLARAYDQSTIFGSGLDWLADILAQAVLLAWWGLLAPAMLPLLLAATAIEFTNCVFDFGTTATGRYPVLDRQGGFGVILDWSMPRGRYTTFGTALWLAYPLFAIAWCLDLSWPVRSDATAALLAWSERLLLVPALLYLWCELAYVGFIVRNWREAPRTAPAAPAAAMQWRGVLPPDEQDLLRRAWREGMERFTEQWQASLARKAVFWVNYWQRSGGTDALPLACRDELDAWARRLAAAHYDAETTILDGYGLIANPSGSQAQAWHIDYSLDYSTLFIPLTELCVENALQYVEVPDTAAAAVQRRAAASPDALDLDAVAGDADWISVRQMIAPPFTVLKMDFGVIHRGIANTAGRDRVMFWVSVARRGAVLAEEPLMQA